jgi:magnesium-protoporphyrin IX monomethyl ester (oxidative) cyclase
MKIKRILLIAPPAYTFKLVRDINPMPPMGLGYLAAVIEDLGIKVDILDALLMGWNQEEEINDLLIRVGLSDEAIAQYIRDVNPDIVGLNCQFSRQYKIYHQMLATIKKVKPECITIAGGAHVSVCPEEILSDPNCDYIIIGEAEESLKDLLIKLTTEEDITEIDGLGWKSNESIYINPKNNWIKKLDALPFPAYHLMKLEEYFGLNVSHGFRHKKKFNPIITSRGCPAKCTFCSAKRVWGNRYRFRSVENVIQEMCILRDTYGIEELMFEDDNLTANPQRAAQLFSRMIEEKFNFVWDTPNGVGVWSIDEKLIDLMKLSGCANLNFPVESGSQSVLNNIIKKPLNLDKTQQLIRYCQRIKLSCNIFLVIGMPGEQLADMWKSFQFAAKCGCYNPHISIATPYPGTELYNICIENGYLAKDFSLDDLFIKSYMIKTKDWGKNGLRRMMLLGQLYLLLNGIIFNPQQILKRIKKNVKKPSDFIRKLMNILFYK